MREYRVLEKIMAWVKNNLLNLSNLIIIYFLLFSQENLILFFNKIQLENISSLYPDYNSVTPSLGSSYADKYPQYESPRLDNSGAFTSGGFNGGYNGIEENCYCVPYDQCLPHEISRKDGLLIDPRSNNKNIEAIGLDDVVITDGKSTEDILLGY